MVPAAWDPHRLRGGSGEEAMNEQKEVVAEERSVIGKQVRQLRRKGLVPAVLYGHGEASIPLQVERGMLQQLVREGGLHSLVRLRVGRREPIQVLTKQVQFHPTSGELLHVDFYRVAAREKLKAPVPLHFVGDAPVEETHDVAIVRAMDEVTVECYPSDLPSALEVDLSRLTEIGSTVKVADIVAPNGVEIVTPRDAVVASVVATSREMVAELEEKAEEAERVAAKEEESAAETE